MFTSEKRGEWIHPKWRVPVAPQPVWAWCVKDLRGLVPDEQRHSRATKCCECVCVCLSLSVFLCACTQAYARRTSLQMSSGRAKCPLDDTLPVRVCLRTHLAAIIRSSGARVKNGVTQGRNAAVGWFVGSVLQILLFISQKKRIINCKHIFLLKRTWILQN